MDFCGPLPKTKNGHDYIMAVVDNLSKMITLIPCNKEITSKQTAELYIRHVFRFHGLPISINSDRGPQFMANFWKHLWKGLKTQMKFSSPYHPESNSLVERQNQTFEENLRTFINAAQDDWDEQLIYYEFAYNNSINPSTGETPFFLNYGQHPTTPVGHVYDNPSPAAQDFIKNLENSLQSAADHIKQNQARAADRNTSKFQECNFKANDLVLLNTTNYNLKLPSAKLAPRWIGPLRIIQVRGPNTVILELPPRLRKIEAIQNVKWLKPYHSRPSDIGPTPQYQPPILVGGQEEFEVEEIIAHKIVNKRNQFLVRFASYGAEDDLWLPEANLKNAPDILKDYWARQTDPKTKPKPKPTAQSAPKKKPRLAP